MPSSGWWLASTPIEPTVVRVETISTSSLKTSPSGVRTSTRNFVRATALALVRGLDDLVDAALHEERRLRQLVVLAVDDLLEGAHRVVDWDVRARRAGERLGDVERLRQEALDLARALHRHLVLIGELVDAEDRDDVLELLVALQDLLDARGDLVVLLADDVRLEDRRGRVERVDRGVDPLLRDAAREHGRRVEVREHRRGRRVGEVVGGHVDRLHRGDRALPRRGDPLLQLAHLGLERRLVADLRRHPAQQGRDLGARLDEPEDVVDEQQHVLALLAVVLRHRQAGERDAHAGAGRLVHLAEDEHRLLDDARLLHLEPEVVALARALTHAAERRQSAVLLGQVVDELLDEHGLADAGAAEQADLAALRVRREQVDDLDAGLEHLRRRRQVLDVRGLAMDRPALDVVLDRVALVDRLAEQVEDAPEGDVADRHGDRATRVDDLGPAREAVRRIHRDRADAVVAEVLLDLADQVGADALVVARGTVARDQQRVIDLGQLVGEDGLDDDALDLLDAPDVAAVAVAALGGLVLGCGSHKVSSLDQRFRAGHDFHDLLRDLGLARPVHLEREVVDDL